jgi:hypothetical protein
MKSDPVLVKEILSLFPIATRQSGDISLTSITDESPDRKSMLSLFQARDLLADSGIEWTGVRVSDQIEGRDHVWTAIGRREGLLLMLSMSSKFTLAQAREASKSGSPDPWAGLPQGSDGPWSIEGDADSTPSESQIDQAIRSFPAASHIMSTGFVQTGMAASFSCADYVIYTREGIPRAELQALRMDESVSIEPRAPLDNPMSAIIADHALAQLVKVNAVNS